VKSLRIVDVTDITVEDSIIGGTSVARTYNQLIFITGGTDRVTIQDSDIGWTLADNTGNTGYGIRCFGTNDDLVIQRNTIHDIAADGLQCSTEPGTTTTVDRNEIGPVGANPGSTEHSDNIQITGSDGTLNITNNWIHHQGYFDGTPTSNAGITYIHGGSDGAILYENNLVETARGRAEVCGFGTGGTDLENITIRANTSTNCTTGSNQPIGYRPPTGVHW
jgi:hypothetical protein